MLYYDHNQRHHYQDHALASGLLFGGILSVYLWTQEVSSNPLLTIIPASITTALVLSSVSHSIWQTFFPSEVEKIYRYLELLASEGTLQGMLREERGSLGSEKEDAGFISC